MKFKILTTELLTIITLAELLISQEMVGSVILWLSYGIYELLMSKL